MSQFCDTELNAGVPIRHTLTMAKKRILIIDDEQKLCQMLKRRLECSGTYDVTVAYSGEEGIEAATEAPFDLVITDFKMPDVNGDQVIDVLKTLRPHLPIALLSVYHDDSTMITPKILDQADGLIGKPIDPGQLLQTIEDLLARPTA